MYMYECICMNMYVCSHRYVLAYVRMCTPVLTHKHSHLHHEQLRHLVPETPSSNFMWVFYGSLLVQQKGMYEFCTTSAEGSRIKLNSFLL